MAETSTKPYMIRALYEWCCDNGYTPYLAVTVDQHTLVPRQHVKGGEIVLNVSPMATSRLSLGNELVEFQARFSGVAQQISVPVGNVSAIYARETGQGMAFEVTPAPQSRERGDAEATAPGADDASSGSGDEGGVHAPGSTVQSLRGGARRRGPRSVLREEPAGRGTGSDGDTAAGGKEGADEARGEGNEVEGAGRTAGSAPAANSRRRSTKGQASADVIAFTPSGSPEKKKGPVAVSSPPKAGADGGASAPVAASPRDALDDDDPPPPESGGKGGKARLTRVK